MDLNKLANEELKQLVKDKKVIVRDIVDAGICPTCFDKNNNHVLYGNNNDKMLYMIKIINA